MVTPLVGLALIVIGVVALEAVHPQIDATDRPVAGVPPLAIDEDRACIRRGDETVIEDIQDAFPSGGRIASTQVFACPAAFDGAEVTYVGEVVGELLPRRGGVWAQVNDDVYALEVGPVIGHRELAGFNTGLSVWIPDGLHEIIGGVGRPFQRGDVILVRGTLLRADPDDGGGTTVRAEELEVLAPTLVIEPPFHTLQAVVAGLLAVLALIAVLWARRMRQT
jgi:hypothetical protein